MLEHVSFDTETIGGAVIWLVMMVLAGFAFYRAKTRRRHIGSAAAGAVYGMMNEDKRKVIYDEYQLIVSEELPVIYTVLSAKIGGAQ